MSFEGDKARLVAELAEAQAKIRRDYGMAPRPERPHDDKSEKASPTARRSSPPSDS